MNGYLLDTHAAIWFFIGDEKLSDAARRIIQDASKSVYTRHPFKTGTRQP
jgi:PIN domain nuclease of toxin-antitoxin system